MLKGLNWDRIRFGVIVALAAAGFPILWKARPEPRMVVVGIIGAVLLYIISEILSRSLRQNISEAEKLFDDFGELEFLNPLYLLLADIVAPFIEELAYRKTVTQIFGLFFGLPAAILLQALLFASPFGHPERCKSNQTEITKRLFFVVGGITYGLIANHFSIWDAVFAHAIFNIGVDLLFCLKFFHQKGDLRFLRLEEAIKKGLVRVGSRVWAEGFFDQMVEAYVIEIGDNQKFIVARESGGREWTFGTFTPHIVVQIS